MARPCTICTHPEHGAIDTALLAGQSYRGIAGQYRVAASSVERHKAEHLSLAVAAARAAAAPVAPKEPGQPLDLLAELHALAERAKRLLDQAEKGDVRTAFLGVRELRGTLDSLASLYERIYSAREVETFQRAVLQAIGEAAPDVRLAIEHALRRRQPLLGAGGLGYGTGDRPRTDEPHAGAAGGG